MSKIGIYAGSFDPFTNGHLDILRKASYLFDLVWVVFAENPLKTRKYNIGDMEKAVRMTLREKGIDNCAICSTSELISDYAKEKNIRYLIRGLRNPNDFSYEENIAKINRELNPDLNTVYFRADNEIISSTMVRQLHKYGKDVSNYVSDYVFSVMRNS